MLSSEPTRSRVDSPSSSQRVVIFGAIAASIAFVMELTLVPLLLPAIQTQFELTMSELSWIFNSYGIAVAIGVLIGGWLGDAFNSRKIFGIGVLFFAFGSTVVAFAETFETLIAGRVFQGFGGGVFSPLIPLLLTQASPRRPGRILIIWGSIAGYVAAFAPFLYGSMLASVGWTLAFILFAVVAVAALSIVSSSQASTETGLTGNIVGTYRTLMRSPDLALLFGYVFCTYGAITYYLFRIPLWLAENDFGVTSTGLSLSVMWLSFSAVSTLLRNQVDKPHIRGILLAAPILIASGFLLAYACLNLACLVLASFFVGSGLACSNAPSTQMILRIAPTRMHAASVSLDITFARLGGVVLVAALSAPMFGHTVFAIVGISVVAFLCALATVNRMAQGTASPAAN